jgi:predicted acylesterase/phospholipase RssA
MSKIGFCFTGEGARGAIQAGIALALHRQGVDADYTVGISSGSLCSAVYAYAGPEKHAEMWQQIKNVFGAFSINWNFLWNRGFLNQKPSERIIKKLVQNPPICEAVVSRLNIISGELQHVSNKNTTPEEFAEAILGAFAITGMVSDRNGWVDAGSRQMAPLEQCINADCTEIYVIMGRPMEMKEFPLPRGPFAIASMAMRALDVSLFELMMRDIYSHLNLDKNIPVHIVHPKIELYNSILFRKCREGVAYGLTEYEKLEEKALRINMLNKGAI